MTKPSRSSLRTVSISIPLNSPLELPEASWAAGELDDHEHLLLVAHSVEHVANAAAGMLGKTAWNEFRSVGGYFCVRQ